MLFRSKKNVDLWKRFLNIYRKHDVKFVWIKGHANNKENEKCDELAVRASESGYLDTDEVYEKENSERKDELF